MWNAHPEPIIKALQGMEYLHQKRIVHFDLKSANLLLGWRDRRAICKVADFGLSKQRRETYVSNVSSQRGTLPWIAPEIIKSPHAVNEKVVCCHRANFFNTLCKQHTLQTWSTRLEGAEMHHRYYMLHSPYCLLQSPARSIM